MNGTGRRIRQEPPVPDKVTAVGHSRERAMRISLIFLLVCMCACEDSTGPSGSDDSVTDSGPNQVPFDGELDAPEPEETIDERSYLPFFSGGEWRYRKKTEDWTMPPQVSEGALTRVVATEEENEYTRTTVAYLTLGDDDTLVRQSITETFLVEPADMRVGPVVRFKSIRVEERTAEGDEWLRTTERSYLPAYRLLSDAWRTGEFENRLSEQCNVVEVTSTPDSEEPQETRGLVNVEVLTSMEPQVLPMEGQYRERVRQIDVSDQFSGTRTRSYWVQQGVGVVQFQFQVNNQQIFTLMETNAESSDDDMAMD